MSTDTKSGSDKGIDQLNEKSIEGSTLQGRFTICRLVNQGQDAQIFKVKDSENPNDHLVVKIVSDTSKFSEEIKATKRISEKNFHEKHKNPRVVSYGLAMFQ